MWVKHLSKANVLVFAHIMFSISLLGVGSLYMGHHFQVRMVCHLQGRSLEGLEVEGTFCYYLFVLHVNQAKGLFLYNELELFFCCNQVLTWKIVSLQGIYFCC